MSRARVRDNSNPVQLFPFVAVLLCTMGSLLVILVVVARCSWDQGIQQATADREAANDSPKPKDEVRQKLAAVHSYVEQLGNVRVQAEEKLQSDQAQLSHLEDHMRRLQEHLESLRAAAGEIDGLEHEHYDDRAQADREVKRLEQLIADQKKDVEELKRNGNHKPRSYAIVPFIGRNGTRRPPIYVECRGKELILQPEGIHLADDDFAPELGPSAPLAAALRAAREYIVSQNGGPNAEVEPYPLLLVRPKGEYGFYESRALFERCGTQFGYELVDGNSDLKYPPANPELAARENQAIELARGRAKALAEAAPGMLHRESAGDDDDNDSGDDFAGGGGGGRYGEGSSDGDSGSVADRGVAAIGPDDIVRPAPPAFGAAGGGTGSGRYAGGGGGGGTAPGGPSNGTSMPVGATGAVGGSGSPLGGGALSGPQGTGLPNLMVDARGGTGGGNASGGSGSGAAPSGANMSVQSNSSGGPLSASGAPLASDISGGGYSSGSNGYSAGSESYSSGTSSSTSGAPPGDSAPRSPGAAIIGPADGSSTAAPAVTVSGRGRSSAAQADDEDEARPTAPNGPGMYQERPPEGIVTAPPDDKPREKHHARGKNWALVDANSQTTPIRRTIQLVVRGDRVAILPEGASATDAKVGGREIPLTGNGREAYEPLLAALEGEIKDWGMAGKGLYWRPVLEINVGPGGEQRESDITRLLKNSGMELRAASAIATQSQGANSGASSSR